jgi:hypothetical protein
LSFDVGENVASHGGAFSWLSGASTKSKRSSKSFPPGSSRIRVY